MVLGEHSIGDPNRGPATCAPMEKPSKPLVVDALALGRGVTERYRNLAVAAVNDHEIRLSVMTERFAWHRHPQSDETFLGVDGQLIIEFEDHQAVLGPGQMLTVPAGILHRTRPAGDRSVNLTFERVNAETLFEDPN